MKNFFFLLALAASVIFSSCDKKDDAPKPAQPPVTPPVTDPALQPGAIKLAKQLLTAHSWSLSGLIQAVPGQTTYTDIYNTYPYCQRDNFVTFDTVIVNRFYSDEGDQACNPLQNHTGTWELKNAKAVNIEMPTFSKPGLTGNFEILTLTNSQLVLKQTVNGTEFTATYSAYDTNPRNFLLRNEWQISDQTISDSVAGVPRTYNSYALMPACEKDDFIWFFDFTGMAFETGKTTCGQVQTTSAYWQIMVAGGTAGKYKLQIRPAGSSQVRYWEIETWSRDAFKVKEEFRDIATGKINEVVRTSYTRR